MVDDIQSGRQFCIIDESVGDEHDHQASVLKDQCRSFPHNSDQSSNACGKQHIQGGVDQEQDRDGGDTVAEFLDH